MLDPVSTDADTNTPYIGRFAPSPTGDLHFGSLVAAVASYLDARAHGGIWAVRIEDVDRTRSVDGASDRILRTLEAHGLHWDGPVVRQTERDTAYADALDRLIREGRAFPCGCTRREVVAAGLVGPVGPIYPGTCRGGLAPGRSARSWRLRMPEGTIRFADRLQGPRAVDGARDIGDFIIRRGDGLFAYHLAMVVDDAELGVSHVVRGADLLDATAPQIALQRALGLPTPSHLHLPVAINGRGRKLSKQTRAPAVPPGEASRTLAEVLDALGHPPPETLSDAPPGELLAWATAAWNPARLPAAPSFTAPENVQA